MLVDFWLHLHYGWRDSYMEQQTTSSTVKAEYVAMSQCAQQMVRMHSWLDEVMIDCEVPRVIKGDS